MERRFVGSPESRVSMRVLGRTGLWSILDALGVRIRGARARSCHFLLTASKALRAQGERAACCGGVRARAV